MFSRRMSSAVDASVATHAYTMRSLLNSFRIPFKATSSRRYHRKRRDEKIRCVKASYLTHWSNRKWPMSVSSFGPLWFSSRRDVLGRSETEGRIDFGERWLPHLSNARIRVWASVRGQSNALPCWPKSKKGRS